MKIIINEKQEKNLFKFFKTKFLKEAALDTFSLEELSKIPSFVKRVKYCREQLGFPIGNGSSRMVFQIDDDKVLKLAKNAKGVAQNEEEESKYYAVFDDVLPRVYEASEDYSYIVSEYVLQAKNEDFQHVFGLTFKDFCDVLRIFYNQYVHRNKMLPVFNKEWIKSDEFWDKVEENDVLRAINDYMCNTTYEPVGDLFNIKNWGLCRRNDGEALVILDNGLSEEIYQKHYNKRDKARDMLLKGKIPPLKWL